MDTDSDNEHDNENEVNLTGFLFGNIDSLGRLEDDIFDNESKKQLASLARFGLDSLLEVMQEDEEQAASDRERNQSGSGAGTDSIQDSAQSERDQDENDDYDYDKKSDTAEDFSEINELAEDLQTAMLSEKAPPTGDNYDETDEENVKSIVKIEPKNGEGASEEQSTTITGEIKSNDNDKELMPPPSVPLKSTLSGDAIKSESSDNGNSDDAKNDKRLETPLAAMLPSKYANIDVRELFPDFRPDKVLRFSRLFGPGKPSSLPQIWRSVRRRRRKRKQSREGRQRDGSDSTSETDERVERNEKGFTLNFGPEPTRDMLAVDDEDLLLREVNDDAKEKLPENNESGDSKPKVADWRYGPAQVWYDMLDVPDSGDGFNYGFKLKDRNVQQQEEEEIEIKGEPIPDDAYLMVSQLHWEDDVVWDGNDIKHKVMQKLNSKTNAAGWLPSSGSRTAGAFSQPGKPNTPIVTGNSKMSTSSKMSKGQLLLQKMEEVDDTWYSIFPVENEELIYSKWEEEVIWDAESMTKIPKPKVLSLDPNDENIILGIPDDIDPSKIVKNTRPPPKVKIPHPHVKKSKILLGKAGVINVLAEDTPPPPPKSPDRDPFNISNDTHYMAKSSERTMRLKVGGGNLIQHSTPVVELRAPFIPTHMGPMRLRAFHRPPMKRFSHGALAGTNPHGVLPLLKNIRKKAKQRDMERIASGGGDVFFMRNPEDLTGKDGEIVLVEFCEEHPPLMNQVGMCSKIKNYYKRKAGKDSGPPEFRYGEVAYAHTSPFLGILAPGRCIQALENNMYRAPIFPHSVQPTDFLLIRTRNEYHIREVDALFTAGQECPLYEVPGPNSKRANNFVRDFLQVFIYRLFWKSRDHPRRIRMDDIKTAFPGHSESSIRKRLKQCADFKRTGMDSNWWVIKPEFRLPSEEEIRAMVSPEQCCAYFSMIAAEQRLKDAGYGEKFIFAQQDDDDEEQQLKMDDEVKVAPWNTTRAYIQAMRGKCLLQLTGPADPTGMGEGFSYVRIPNKPTQSKEEIESQPKRTVTGTDADLRRLSLNNAKALLRKFMVPEEEIKKLSRWEVIDVVRTLSTEKAKAGEEGMDKFSRGNRFSIAEHQERYKEECQRIFDLQNKVLSSNEVLSTDEGESTVSEESDLEELGKNLENMLANKKTSTQLSLEREEQERQELLKKIMEEREAAPRGSKKKDEEPPQLAAHLQPGRILKITRTFKNSEGKEFTRIEIVRRPQVIDAYVKIRNTKDEAFIRQFATLDEAQKEEMKREKRRIQEQLRRIKRNQEKVGLMHSQSQQLLSPGVSMPLGDSPTHTSKTSPSFSTIGKDHTPSSKEMSPTRRKIKLKPDLKLKCGACGQVGHMRTNKACPLYTGTIPTPSLTVAMTEEQEEEIEKELNADDEDLVNVDGTKVKLSGKLLKRHEDVKRRTLLLKVPKEAVKGKRRRAGTDIHCDYLRHNKTAKRSRTDPVVVMSSILEQILNEMRDMPDVQPFLFPVNIKKVPDYYKVVQRPMDLQGIRENLRQNKYQSREEFLADVNQIVENSSLYNGAESSLTAAGQRMLRKCVEHLAEKEERLMRLEKAINPLLDDDDQVALSFIFEKLINEKLKNMPESWLFKKPVNKKQFKDYYTVIRKPMDLETITKKVSAHKYHSRAEFIADVELIATNCEQYNGGESKFTKQARLLVDFTKKALDEFGDHCAQLEKNIALVQERVKIEAEMDDTWADDDNDERNTSRASSPDNDFVDVESTTDNRPHSSASVSLLKQSGPQLIAPMPEVKRNRGRPRKLKDPSTINDDSKVFRVKRGRGRPRKNSLNSNLSNTQNSYLEEERKQRIFKQSLKQKFDDEKINLDDDLQFSTDDEEFEEVVGDFESVAATLGQGEALARSAQPVHYLPGAHGEDESKQAAEAMVQLSSAAYYNQPEQGDESMDLDPNYDPSDFLKMSSTSKDTHSSQPRVTNESESVSVDYSMNINIKQEPTSHQQQSPYDQSPFNMSEMLMYKKEPEQSDPRSDVEVSGEPSGAHSQSSIVQQENIAAIHDDLAISDSDEDEQAVNEGQKKVHSDNDNDDDGDGLWF